MDDERCGKKVEGSGQKPLSCQPAREEELQSNGRTEDGEASLFLSRRQLTINKGEGRESPGGPGRKAFYPGREEKRRGEKRDCCCPGVGDLTNVP